MAVEAGVVRVIVDVQASGVTKELNKVEKGFDKAAKSANSMDKGSRNAGKGMGKMGIAVKGLGAKLKALMLNPLVLAAAAIVALGKVMKDSFGAYQATVDSQRKLKAALQAGTGATKEQYEALDKLADSLELTTGVGDDQLRQLFALANGWGMNADAINMFGAELAAIQKVGGPEALEGLAKGTEAAQKTFARFGVQLTQAEMDMLKSLDASERLEESIKLMGRKGVDFAQPFEDAGSQMAKIKAHLGNIQEKIGSVISKPVLDFFTKIEELLTNNVDTIDQFGQAVGDISIAFFDLFEIVGQVRNVLAELGIASTFKESLQFVTDTLNLISGLIGGISALFKGEFDIAGLYLKKALDGFLGMITRVVTKMMAPFQMLFKGILNGLALIPNVFNGIVNGFINGFEGFINGAIWGINQLIKALNLIPGVNIGEIGKVALGNIDVSADDLKEAAEMIDNLDEDLENVSLFTEEDAARLEELLKDEEAINDEDNWNNDNYISDLDDSNQDVRENIEAASSTLNKNFDDLFKDISRSIIDPRTGNVGAFATNIISSSPDMIDSFTGGMGGTSTQTITTDVVLDGQRVGKAMTNVFKLSE